MHPSIAKFRRVGLILFIKELPLTQYAFKETRYFEPETPLQMPTTFFFHRRIRMNGVNISQSDFCMQFIRRRYFAVKYDFIVTYSWHKTSPIHIDEKVLRLIITMNANRTFLYLMFLAYVGFATSSCSAKCISCKWKNVSIN